jgi:ABC-2 type transport system permease protein
MAKFWRVFQYEYSRHVMRRGFLFGLLSVPLIILLMAGLVLVIERSERDDRPVGYIDQSGLLARPLPSAAGAAAPAIQIIAYAAEDQADAALQAGEIQAYFVLGPDYLETSQARAVAVQDISDSALAGFKNLLRAHLLADQPAAILTRLSQGDVLLVRSADGSREANENQWVGILLPFFIGIAYMIAIFSSSGYLMQAVVDEKENRTMEVLLTSTSPNTLIGAKTVAMILVGMTQLLAWLVFAGLVLLVGSRYFPFIQQLQIPAGLLSISLAIFVPCLVTISALMVMIGSSVTDVREGQQLTGLLTLPVVLPYWFAIVLITNPNSPLSIALSFFPLTAPVANTMRLAFGTISAVQIVAILIFQWLCAIGSLWLAGRAFRIGMLSYGRRLSFREVLGGKLRQEPQP